MIKEIRLKNFMSHKNLHLVLGKNFYVITGENDIGKSALFHAVRWVFLGEPSGSAMIHQGESFAEVTILLEGPQGLLEVTRRKTVTTNKFIINGEEYHKNDVPESIRHIFTVEEFGEDKVSWNFTFQHDPLFMLANSNFTNLQVINTDPRVDEALKITKSKLTSLIKQEIDLIESIKKLEALLEIADPLQDKLNLMDQELKILTTLIAEKKEYFEKLKNLGKNLERLIPITSLKEIPKLLQLEKAPVLNKIVPLTTLKDSKILKLGEKLCPIIFIEKLPDITHLEEVHKVSESIKIIKTKVEEAEEIKAKTVELQLELDLVKVCPTCGKALEGKGDLCT